MTHNPGQLEVLLKERLDRPYVLLRRASDDGGWGQVRARVCVGCGGGCWWCKTHARCCWPARSASRALRTQQRPGRLVSRAPPPSPPSPPVPRSLPTIAVQALRHRPGPIPASSHPSLPLPLRPCPATPASSPSSRAGPAPPPWLLSPPPPPLPPALLPSLPPHPVAVEGVGHDVVLLGGRGDDLGAKVVGLQACMDGCSDGCSDGWMEHRGFKLKL